MLIDRTGWHTEKTRGIKRCVIPVGYEERTGI